MKLRLLYRVTARPTGVSRFGDTPYGSRSDYHLEGEVVGRVSGRFRAVDYGLAAPKGVHPVSLHVHETIETDDGLVSVMRRGYVVPEEGRGRVKATCTFQTSSKNLGFLNTTVALAEGYADEKRGLRLSVFALE
ncbi:MAG: hypothetical protein ABSF83_08230 [Nitrososphaerales archaeon]